MKPTTRLFIDGVCGRADEGCIRDCKCPSVPSKRAIDLASPLSSAQLLGARAKSSIPTGIPLSSLRLSAQMPMHARCHEDFAAVVFTVGDDGWEEQCSACGEPGDLVPAARPRPPLQPPVGMPGPDALPGSPPRRPAVARSDNASLASIWPTAALLRRHVLPLCKAAAPSRFFFPFVFFFLSLPRPSLATMQVSMR